MKNYIPLILIITLTIIFYSSSLSNDFLNWDDSTYIQGGPYSKYIQDFSFQSLKKLFNPFSNIDIKNYYHPIGLFTLSLDYFIWRENPAGFHFTNLFIFICNLIFIYFTTIKLCKSTYIAAIGTFLFAIHPIHSETVCWISARPITLAGLFCFATFYFFILSIEPEKKNKLIFYLLSLILFIIALFSHPVSCFLPLLFIFYFCYFPEKVRKEKLLYYIFILSLFFIIILIFQGTLFFTHAQESKAELIKNADRTHNIYTSPILLIKYLFLIIYPPQLSTLYYPITGDIKSFFLSFLVILILFFISIKNKILLFAFTWMIIFYLPVSHIIAPLLFYMADRYFYLPSYGFILFFTVLSLKLIQTNIKLIKIFTISILIIIIISLYSITRTRIAIWHDDIALWSDAINKTPSGAEAYSFRGQGYFRLKNYYKAIEDFNRAIDLGMNDSNTLYYRGISYGLIKEYDKSLSDLNQAIIISPKYIDAYYSRAMTFINKKEYNSAIKDLMIILYMKPDHLETKFYLKKITRL